MKAVLMSVDRWMDKNIVYIYNGILATEKNKIIPFTATWTDLEIIILNEASQKEKGKYPNMVWYHLYMESKKWYKWTYLQNKETHKQRKQIYSYQRKKGVGGTNLELRISRYKLLFTK